MNQISLEDHAWYNPFKWHHRCVPGESVCIPKGDLLKSHIAFRCGLISDPNHYDGTIEFIDGNEQNHRRENLRLKP